MDRTATVLGAIGKADMFRTRRSSHLLCTVTFAIAILSSMSACSSSEDGSYVPFGAGGALGLGGATNPLSTASTGGSTFAAGSTTTVFGAGGNTSDTGAISTFGGNPATGTSATTSATTWTSIYNQFFAAGTAGNCIRCHAFGASAADLYAELRAAGQINGTSSAIATNGASILNWFGGIMPEGGSRNNPAAVTALKAWVAAGALNN